MSLSIRRTSQFKKDYKRMIRRGVDASLLRAVVETLAEGKPLPPQNRDHALTGEFAGHRECHIRPDWLLVYLVRNDVLVLTLVRTGTHADLFGK